MTWFAFKGYGTVDVAGVQEKDLTAAGFHGYATEAQANANPNSVNILQKVLVNEIELDYQTALKTQSQPGGANASNPLAQAEQGVLSGWNLQISGISGWFLRGLKVLFGGVMMVIGISHMLGLDNKITQLAGQIPIMPL